MIGSIISAILWFLIGAVVGIVVICLFGMFCISFINDEEIGSEPFKDAQKEFMNFSKKFVGDHSDKF